MLRDSYTYDVILGYGTVYSCESSGCNDDGICRCSKIVDPCITNIDILAITCKIYSDSLLPDPIARKRDSKITSLFNIDNEVITKYCINRILTINKLYLPSNWAYNICSGYYGEEIENIYIANILHKKISIQLDELMALDDDSDRVRYVLNLEYGKVLEKIKNAKFIVAAIYKSDIDFKKLNQNHIRNVKMSDTSYYADYFLPRGIISGIEGNYKIIDGYHRIIEANNKKPFEVLMVKN